MISHKEGKRVWVELSIKCSREVEEPLVDYLVSELGRGVITEEVEERQDLLLIKAYLSREDLESGAFSSIKTYLEELSAIHPEAILKIENENVIEEDWHDKWKRFFRPIRIGESLVIKPTWEEYVPEVSDIVIEMDPGRAFGVGSHASTRLVLERLEELGRKGVLEKAQVLDVGTGSGILAIAASKLGAKSVLAIDIDPDAVESARKNVHLNNCHDDVTVSITPVWEVEGPFDLVLANIDRDTLLLLAKEISSQVCQGGRLLLSGILKEQAGAVKDAYVQRGLRFSAMRVDEKDSQWVLLEFLANS